MAQSSLPPNHPYHPWYCLPLRALPSLLPGCLLLVAMLRTTDSDDHLFGIGAAFLLLGAVGCMFRKDSWSEPFGPALVVLSLLGLGWVLLVKGDTNDWYLALLQALFLMMPLAVFGYRVLRNSGVLDARRAQRLADRIRSNRTLPQELSACQKLPEVKALREAVADNATPALALLGSERPEVRMAGLCAMEFRKQWHKAEAELVLWQAKKSGADVRAAAIYALGNVEERSIVESLAEFLRDESPIVRDAAEQALLWDTEKRWSWIRTFVRDALADHRLQHCGPIKFSGILSNEANTDLLGWTALGGVLAVRAAQTLGVHYRRALLDSHDRVLLDELRERAANPHLSVPLRQEVIFILHEHHELEDKIVRSLLHAATPANLRLFVIRVLLEKGEKVEACAVLKALAHAPNREIALGVASLVQQFLGTDFGLSKDEVPQLHTREAAEITRRVMHWATTFVPPETVLPDPSKQSAWSNSGEVSFSSPEVSLRSSSDDFSLGELENTRMV